LFVPVWRTPKDDNNNEQKGGQENAAVLPASFKDVPALADFKDVGSLGNAYVEIKKMQGSSIRIPGEDNCKNSDKN